VVGVSKVAGVGFLASGADAVPGVGADDALALEAGEVLFAAVAVEHRVQGFRGSGVRRFKGSEVQRFRGSEVQGFRGSEVQRFRGSGVQRFRGSEVQGLRASGIRSGIRRFRVLKIFNRQ
tara:strand:- start:779 stop:1138 length:360 start_codon:yes stop_codon:yes gene_type:complete